MRQGVPIRLHCQLRAENRANSRGQRGSMKAGRAIDTVAIEQRDRGVPIACRLIDERFRQ
jgi:hypothetical protein